MRRLAAALAITCLVLGCVHGRGNKRSLDFRAIRQAIPVGMSCPDEADESVIGDDDDRFGRRLRYQTQNGLNRPQYCKMMIIIVIP